MKDIPGYEKEYAITENGEVWSYKSNKFLKSILDKNGYLRISLSSNGIIKEYSIHRLVALTYISNLENKPTVDHIDRNKLNNNVNNLRWATSKEQANNRDKSGEGFTKEESLKGAKISSDNNSKQIEMRDKDNHNILYKIFRNAEDAAEEITNDRKKGSMIRKVARGVKSSAYGYYWSFKDNK